MDNSYSILRKMHDKKICKFGANEDDMQRDRD